MFKVRVIRRKGKGFALRWADPVTGKTVERKAKSARRSDAMVEAGVLERQLEDGEIGKARPTNWEAFKDLFVEDELADCSDSYRKNVKSTLRAIDREMGPKKLETLAREEWLQQFRKKVQDRSAATVHKYFQHLQTMLRFAARRRLIARLPEFPKLRGGGGRRRHMKGRPVSEVEYQRMLDHCPTESLQDLVTGLWLSGLRLGEALSLTWDQWSDGIRITESDSGDLFLLIDGDDQKNRRRELYPVVDDFANWLREHQTEGFVFNPQRQKGVSRRVDTVSEWICKVGEAAEVKVDQANGKPSYASAHDLRRAFGTRWSRIVTPQLLQRLMRHSNLETTMNFYVESDAAKDLELIRRYSSA